MRAPLTETSGSCLLEEIELLPRRRREPIRSLLILHSQSALFVGLREHVAKIPLKRCPFHRTRRWAAPGAPDGRAPQEGPGAGGHSVPLAERQPTLASCPREPASRRLRSEADWCSVMGTAHRYLGRRAVSEHL